MAENVTTVLVFPELESLLGSDVLYVIRGTGSDRDHNAKLSTLLEYIASGLNGISFSGPEGANEISNGAMSIEGNSGEMLITQQQLSFTKNGTTYSVVIDRNGITITSGSGSVSISSTLATISKTVGGVTKTITLDPDLVRMKTLKGTTLVGESTFALTIEDTLEVTGNLISRGAFTVGTSQNKKNATIHGSLIADKVQGASFNITKNLISSDSDVDLTELDPENYVAGDVIFVHNSGTTQNKVFCKVDISDGLRVRCPLNAGCTLAFRCVTVEDQQWEQVWNWSPMSNVTMTKESS